MKLVKFNTILFLLLGLAFQSCLDIEPKDQLSETNYWKNPDQFTLFSSQFYGWTHNFSNIVSDGLHSDLRSDLLMTSTLSEYSNGTNTIPQEDKNYTDIYSRIRQVNILLKNAENYSSPLDIKVPVAEAQFFRAYLYFDLLQIYGDAIIVKEPMTIDSPELQVSQNPREEVVDFIIQDLNNAIAGLPAYKSLSAAEDGRVSMEAAQAFLSRVALYEGTWQKFRENDERGKELLKIAVDAAKAVIDSRVFSLFQPKELGVFAYKYLFILENTQSNPANLTKSANTEYIFSRRYDEVLNSIGFNITQGFVNKAVFMTRKMANMYLTDKGLPIDPTDENMYKKMDSEFANRDNRMQNTMMIAGRPYWANTNGRMTWKEDATDLELAFYKSFDPKSRSGYFCQKWATERKVASGKEGYDFPIIRYAEVLLNYAEAVYELNESEGKADDQAVTDALNISLNLVRTRVNPDMEYLTVAFAKAHNLNLRTEIRRERTVELFHEGFRMDDLKRWNIAVNEMNQNLLGVKWEDTEFEEKWTAMSNATDAEGCIIMESGRKWNAKNNLYPLSADQLRLNTNLKQNPGWGE